MESKPEDLFSTNDLIHNVQFSDIFNLEDIQRLQDIFADAKSVASVINNIDGTPITIPSNFCRLYTDFILKTEKGNANCLKSDAELSRKSSSGPVINQFLSGGLWDAGARITVGGRHIANWIIGQVRDEKMDIHLLINYADEIGVDREDFLNALIEVPVMSLEKFTKISETLYLLTNEYSEKAYSHWLLRMQTSENERAAEVIKKSEHLIASMYDTIEDVIFQLKVESHERFRFVSANHSFYRVTGLSEKEVIGKLVSDVIPDPSFSLALSKYRQAIKESSVIHWEEISDYPAGRLIGDVSISPVYDDKGKCTHLVGSVHDVTERKLAERELLAIKEELQKSYLYARSLIEASLDPLVTINTDGKITDVNTATEKVTGISRNHLIGTDFSDYFTEPQKARTGYQEVFEKGYVIDYPLTICHTSGQLIDVLYNANIYHDENGVIVGIFAAARDITKRKMVEEALQKSEEKWRTIFEILPVGVSILDKNGNISEHNPALERILQLTAEELQGQQFKHRKYVYYENGEIRSDEYPTHISVQEQKIIRNIEVGVKKEDGDIIWTEVSAAPLNLPDAICAVVTTDITEHKRLEKELRRSELLLNNTQQLTHVGGWEWDVKKQSMFWTKGLYELYDLDPNKYIPGAPGNFDLRLECYLSEDGTKIRNAFQQCVVEGVPYDYEFRFTTFKERSLWIRMIIKPVLRNGKVVKVIGVIMDIHERKLFEKELIEREINYTVLFNTVRQAIYIQNSDSTVISVNKGAVEMYGYEKEYFIVKTPEFLSAPGKNDMTQIMEYLKLAYQGRPQKYEFWGKKRNGIIFPEEIWTVKGRYFGQEVLISLAIDITERELAEAEIKRKNEELQKINAEKDRFFSIIAHDLRSPFTGFLGLTDLMVEKMSSLELDEIHELALIMRTSANNLFRLLGNLLEWSRMQRGLTVFNPTQFLLMPKISEALVLVLDGADKKKIVIMNNIPEDLEVYADANMLGLIIRNLVTNAVKFTPTGGSITISAKTLSDQSVEFSIKDTGIGMNAYMVDNLFRLDVNTSRKGTEGELSTGLGLVLSKDFIEKHKGKLWVESEEGKGSDFRFTLPGNLE